MPMGRVGSVPPACRGNLMEGVIGHTRFCELWLRDWYYTGDKHQYMVRGEVIPTALPKFINCPPPLGSPR